MESHSAGSSAPVLRIAGLTVIRGVRRVLAGVDLEVHAGESVSIMGESGSGKTTILTCILGLLPITQGSITVAGEPVDAKKRGRTAALRRRTMGAIFQTGELLPELTPTENILIAALLNGTGHGEALQRASRLLEALGVPSGRRSTGELSGGERQRVAVARALVNEPVLLLADEPTGSLDRQARETTLDILLDASRQRGCALVVVTHDAYVAARTDRALRLREERLVPYTPVENRSGTRNTT